MSTHLFAVYVLVFALAASACFLSIGRVPRIPDSEVRVGLFGLLATSGGWAAAHVGYLVVPTNAARLAFYVVGLVVGFAAVGAWLYFCSAYTGRTYHRQRPYRYAAVAMFGAVTVLKLTNPIHSLYFTAEPASAPFGHLAVTHGILHWAVMGLAYALAVVGFFMLFERFVSVGISTTPLAVLVGVTAFPIVFDVLALVSPTLLDMTYEPIGIAVFAVGVLFVYTERFQRVTLAGETDTPVVFIDEDDHVRDYNRRASALFPALEGAPGTPLADVSQDLAAALATEGHVIETSSSTGLRYYLVSVTPFTAGDTTTGSLLTLSDVTETEQYRRELQHRTEELEAVTAQLQEQYRTLFEEAPVMTVVTRAEQGRPIIVDSNDQFIDRLGYGEETLVGTDLVELYTPDSRERLLEDDGYERSLEDDFTQEHRELLTADGEVVETVLRAVPRRDTAGEVVGTLGMYVDITEQEILKRANERLEEFTSIVSHDLRNPLTVARGNLELAREESDSEHLDDVAWAHDRMDTLIEDLLTLAREGEQVGDVEPVALDELVSGCWETVATADASLQTGTDRSILADRSRLQQLLENLLRNAIEHGGDDVTITTGDLADGFYVADDGPGIAESDRETVFESGYSTGQGGTGFGLNIAKQIVEAHGWDIRVTDGDDGGARFEITGVESTTG